ncbi:unnamed protein product [Brassica rapa subsp. trilocularis]
MILCCIGHSCYSVLRFFVESGAKGCEVIVTRKLRAARAKSMKFKNGYMVCSGQPVKHVLLRQILQLMDTWVGNGNFDEVLATMHPKIACYLSTCSGG